ncbi:MAG: hypothetical protein WA688_05385 [Thermoplasmata archaeon]
MELVHCVAGWSANLTISLYNGVYDSTSGTWVLTNQYTTIASLSTASVSCVNGVKLDSLGSSYPVWSDKLFAESFSGSVYLYSTSQYESDLGIQFWTYTNGPYNSNGDYASAVIDMGGTGSLCTPCGDYFQYIDV